MGERGLTVGGEGRCGGKEVGMCVRFRDVLWRGGLMCEEKQCFGEEREGVGKAMGGVGAEGEAAAPVCRMQLQSGQ